MFQESQLKIQLLNDRAFMLREARDFFFDRQIMEVDCPLITKYASIDAHIDLIPIQYLETETRYLHSSAEYGMKRLLSLEIGDIYQLAHVFRNEGHGKKHNPEFMMAEWYRISFTLNQMIDETVAFIKLFIGNIPVIQSSYRETFLKFTGVDYLTAKFAELEAILKNHQIEPYPGIEKEGKDAYLNLILGTIIEKELGKNEIFVLYHYPSSQAALAKTVVVNDEIVAERFEIYHQGIELCNGYHELLNVDEQRQRFEQANFERLSLEKNELPLDEYFLQALQNGIPDCSGVAVGFDRLMMLRHNAEHIEQVVPFAWPTA